MNDMDTFFERTFIDNEIIQFGKNTSQFADNENIVLTSLIPSDYVLSVNWLCLL